MLDVLNLALPFFGLIFIGFACGKLKMWPIEQASSVVMTGTASPW
jgi:hypothetical protein